MARRRQVSGRRCEGRLRLANTGRLILKKHCFFALVSRLKMGFDQQGLIWYVFRPLALVYS